MVSGLIVISLCFLIREALTISFTCWLPLGPIDWRMICHVDKITGEVYKKEL